MGSKQEEPRTPEEDEILEEGLDEHCLRQDDNSRGVENNEACVRHGGGKDRRKENYTERAQGHSAHGGAESENMRSGSLNSQGRSRRRPDLTLPLPQRDLTSLAVSLPLPLQPSSAPSPGSLSGLASLVGPTTSPTSAAGSAPPLCELERVRRVGSGAGGTVWMVRHRPTGRAYALKVLHGSHDAAVRRHVARQVAVLRTTEHPAVVRCHGMYEQAGGELQVLYEYMDGGSLEGRRVADETFLAHVARQVLSGVAYLHRRHVVHRDIKPSKLLIDSSRRVKIADFGVGRVLNQTMDPCNSSVGSIAYMSPERIDTDLNDGAYDGYAGDIWSFGLSILELYLGRFPLGENLGKQGDWAALMREICYSDSPQAPHNASPEFKNFISLCLQKNPANRPAAIRLLQHPFVAQPQTQTRVGFTSGSEADPMHQPILHD